MVFWPLSDRELPDGFWNQSSGNFKQEKKSLEEKTYHPGIIITLKKTDQIKVWI